MKKTREASVLVLIVALALGAASCAAQGNQTPDAAASTASTANVAAPSSVASSAAASSSATADGSLPASSTQPSTTAEGATAGANAVAEPSREENDEKTQTVAAASTSGGVWPQWRGPNRDGNIVGVAAPRAWPKALKEEWKVTVGTGHASPVVVDGKAYIFARQGEDETLLALDAATGKELWRSSQRVAYEMNPAATGHGKGPKSTPVVSGRRVFTLGITGILSAHDARNGRLIWRKDFSKQFPSTSPLYGTSMSPVVERNLLIAHVGGHDKGALTAFDAETGAVKWAYDADGPAYSSPIIATLAGERQVVTFTQKEFVGVSAATGKLLWKLAAKTGYDTNCVTAVVYQDSIIFSLESAGMMAIRPVRRANGFAVEEVWRNGEHMLYMNSPVLQGNLLFGLSARKKGQFFCLDAATGKTLWQSGGRMGENAAILNLSGTLLLLTNDANLIILPANAKEYAPVAQYTVATSPTWAHPVVLADRILVKDETTLASLSLSKQ
ncbi:MAG TPA: PQQ-binding-like beta-propeller repeat protein [Pyrinomonadaceae bacterium]|jgi:outer membrane protein assembly factor BamB